MEGRAGAEPWGRGELACPWGRCRIGDVEAGKEVSTGVAGAVQEGFLSRGQGFGFTLLSRFLLSALSLE